MVTQQKQLHQIFSNKQDHIPFNLILMRIIFIVRNNITKKHVIMDWIRETNFFLLIVYFQIQHLFLLV
jgi:hypothetical protein